MNQVLLPINEEEHHKMKKPKGVLWLKNPHPKKKKCLKGISYGSLGG
jgi:hypothetical protein